MMKTALVLGLAAVGASTCSLDGAPRITAQAESQRCDLVAAGLAQLMQQFDARASQTAVVRAETELQAEMFIGALSAGDITGEAWMATPRLSDEQRAIRRRLRDGLVSVEPCLDHLDDALGVQIVEPDAPPSLGRDAEVYAVLGPLIIDDRAERAFLSVLTREDDRGACWDAIQFRQDENGELAGSLVWNAPGSCVRL